MRKIAIFFVIMTGIMVLMMAGCGHAHKHEAHEHDENLQLTAYNDLFEVYAEVSPLVVNETAEVVAHFTWLRDFKPLEAGTVTATLTVGGKTVSQTMETPVREGIYKFSITPPAKGNGQMSFEIICNGTSSTIIVPNVTVYDDAHDAQHAAAAAKATSINGVVFTKEMSWKVDFSTDSCRKTPFGQIIHTMGQVQPSQGDEYAITAKADGIVSINGELTEGKSVKAGQTLFSIESGGLAEGNLDVRYQEAENNYLLAKAEYERKQSLAADNIVSSSDLQQAKTRYENAKTLYQNLKRNFSSGRQSVGAPISGYLRQLSVRNGDFVHAGQTMAVVTQNRDLFVKADFAVDSFVTHNFWASEACGSFIVLAYNFFSLFRHALVNSPKKSFLKTIRYEFIATPAYFSKSKDKHILYLARSLKTRSALQGIWNSLDHFSLPYRV